MDGHGTVYAEQQRIAGATVTEAPTTAARGEVRPEGFEGKGSAGSAAVNWSRQDRTSLTTAATPGGLVGVADAPPSSGESRHGQVQLELEVAHAGASLGWEGSAWRVRSDGGGPILLAPADVGPWTVGPGAEAFVGAAPPALHANITVPPGQVALGTSAGTVSLAGEGRLYLWGVNVTLTDEEGARHHYRSGEWTDNETGPGGAARTLHAQFLSIQFELATIAFQLEGDHLRWAMPAAVLTGTHLSVPQADGQLTVASETVGLDGGALEIDGRVDLQTWVAEGEDRLTSDMDFTGAATVDGRSLFDVRPNLVTRLQPLAPPLGAASLLLLVAGVAWLAVARARRPRDLWLTAAERALSRNHPWAAQREARGLLRATPDDADAWFVYAAGLLQSRDHDRLVRELEPVAHRLGSDQTRGLAFVLALAHARMAAPERAAPWLALASEDPELRNRAALEPALQPVLDLSAAA